MSRVTHDGQRWSNADADRVEIVPYDDRWPSLFDEEARRLRSQLGDAFGYAIEHVGSTAVAGLASKPIIDIILIVSDVSRWPSIVHPLEVIGYVYWAENPDASRMFFVKGMPPFGTGRTHHVHVRTPDDARAAIRFRDFLIAHPDTARRYETLKRELAARFPTDRDAYTNAKAAFVADVLARASR